MYKYVLLTACLKLFIQNFKAVAGGNTTLESRSSITEVNNYWTNQVAQTEELPHRSSEGITNEQEVNHLSEEDRHDPELEENRRRFMMQTLHRQEPPWAENLNAYRRRFSPLPSPGSTLKSITRMKSSLKRKLERKARRAGGKRRIKHRQILRQNASETENITTDATNNETTATEATTEKKGEKLEAKDKNDTSANHTTTNTTTSTSKDASFINVHTIFNDLMNITEEFPDLNITLEILDKTLGYNDIVLMKIKGPEKEETNNKTSASFRAKEYSDEDTAKGTIFIVHGLSVEGFSKLPCLIQYSDFKQLLSYYFKHLDKFDIFFIPFANPDGVVATYTKAYWNKNMSPQKACPGVALDRNFDVAWNLNRSTCTTCDQSYPGQYPFSEVESIVVRDVLHKYSHKITAYLHVHPSGLGSVFRGDGVLYPRGYTKDEGDNEKYNGLRATLEETFKNASFKVYSMTVESLYNWYGPISGSSVDYAASVYGVPFAAELVMQIYSDDTYEGQRESTQSAALREVWGRAIDQIFNTIYGPKKFNPELQEKSEAEEITETNK